MPAPTRRRKTAPPPSPIVVLWSKRPSYLIPLLGILMVITVGAYITGTQLEEHDNFCASCHTQPEDQFYTRSLESTSQDLASFHTTKGVLCIQCHAGKGLIGRSLGLAAGAQDLVAFYSGHYPQPAKLEEPMPDSNCTRCHADVLTKQDFSNHFHVFLARWRAVDPKNVASCVSCHSSHSTTGLASDMYLMQDSTLQICQRCHASVGGG
jgi:predicted CXXCH cytochrome family protein